MGLSLHDYDEITLVQFFNKMQGFYELERQRQKNEWERISYVAYSIMINNPYIKNSQKPKSFESFMNQRKIGKKKLTKDQFLKAIDG